MGEISGGHKGVRKPFGEFHRMRGLLGISLGGLFLVPGAPFFCGLKEYGGEDFHEGLY